MVLTEAMKALAVAGLVLEATLMVPAATVVVLTEAKKTEAAAVMASEAAVRAPAVAVIDHARDVVISKVKL